MFTNISLLKRTLASVGVALAGIVIVAFTAYSGFSKIGTELVAIAEYQVPLNSIIAELERDILKEEILTYELIIASKDISSKEFKNIGHNIIELEEDTDKVLKKAEKLVEEALAHSDNEKIRSMYKVFSGELKTLENEQERFKKELKQFEYDLKSDYLENIDAAKKALHKTLINMNGNITKLMHQMEIILQNSTKTAEKDEKTAIKVIIIVSTIVLVISLIMSYLLISVMKMTLNRIGNTVETITKENNLTIRLRTDAPAEISKIAHNVNELIASINNLITDADRKSVV